MKLSYLVRKPCFYSIRRTIVAAAVGAMTDCAIDIRALGLKSDFFA